MRRTLFTKAMTLILIASLTAPAFARDKKKKSKAGNDKNDPTLVGKRDINKGQLSLYSLQREIALGRRMAAEIDRRSTIINDPAVNEYINRIMQNIVLHSDAKIPFTVKVIDSADVNAFALPGGFLYVHRGLIEAAENEAELAGVMAHEIAHVTARHGIEQASKGEMLNYASIPLIFFGGLGGYLVRQVAGIAVPLTFLKFSRGAEKEADRLGAQYVWAAGYDPNALITFFEKLQAQDKRKPGTLSKLFSTHPLTSDRITEARDVIASFPDRGEYQISTSEFGQIRSRLIAANPANRQTNRDPSDRRPTLKRRPQSTDDNGNGTHSETQDRPKLKRPDSSSADSESSSSNDNTAGNSENKRPTLKRNDGSSTGDQAKPQQPSTSSSGVGRPTLKRKTDQGKD